MADSLVAKFRKMADDLDAKIKDGRKERLTNTHKRQEQARSVFLESVRLERTQTVLRRLADFREGGTLPSILAGVKDKSKVYNAMTTRVDWSRNGYDTEEFHLTDPVSVALQNLFRADADPAAANEAKRQERIRQMEDELRFSDMPGFFPSPPAVVEKILELAEIRTGHKVLEPSAGTGSILAAIPADTKRTAVEVRPKLVELLELKFPAVPVYCMDFIEWGPGDGVDRVCMNPPFEKGQDMRHVRHAYRCLAKGGRLVSVMGPGFTFRSDNASTEFRAWFEEVGGEKIDLPTGSFKGIGAFRETGTSSVLVVIDR